MKIFKSCLIWILLWINLSIAVPLLLITSLFIKDGHIQDRIIFAFCRYIVKCLFIRTELVYLSDEVKKIFPVIFVANHVSFLDIFISGATLPGYPRGFEIYRHFNKPFYGWFIRKFGQISIDPRSKASILNSIKEGKALLDSKRRNFFIMPEGTRTRDGELGKFNNGAFYLSEYSAAPIVPVVFKNLFNISNANSFTINPGKVTILIGEPIYPERFSTKEEMADFTKSYMNKLLKEK